MNDSAGPYLADQVFPGVPVRQWVLTVPWWLRARLHCDTALASEVLFIFLAWSSPGCASGATTADSEAP